MTPRHVTAFVQLAGLELLRLSEATGPGQPAAAPCPVPAEHTDILVPLQPRHGPLSQLEGSDGCIFNARLRLGYKKATLGTVWGQTAGRGTWEAGWGSPCNSSASEGMIHG